VFLNTESEVSCGWEIFLLELSILDLQTSFENLIGLISSDGDVDGNFLISFNSEASNSESSSGWNWLLSGEIFQDFRGYIIQCLYLWWVYLLINRHWYSRQAFQF
jgi:hypothetical protein